MSGPAPARIRAERAGRRAETLVAWWLRLSGHAVLARRFRCRDGEIDIIARRGRTLRFIEVKQRADAGAAVETVSARSEGRILRASEAWMVRNPAVAGRVRHIRHDVVTVIGRWRIHTLRGAFRGW